MEPLIDSGGARKLTNAQKDIRIKERIQLWNDSRFQLDSIYPTTTTVPTTVTLKVVETHNEVECNCIDQSASEMTLTIGDTIELNHVCNDGRVDKVIATVMRIDVAKEVHPLEHITVSKY